MLFDSLHSEAAFSSRTTALEVLNTTLQMFEASADQDHIGRQLELNDMSIFSKEYFGGILLEDQAKGIYFE